MGQQNHTEKYIQQDEARMGKIIHVGAEEQGSSADGSLTSTVNMVCLT
jgi:hypothetical protein